jgi:threonyl-tRNA synthetase
MSSTTIELVLPDGSRLELPQGVTAYQVAADIGPGLAAAALAAQVDGEWVDLREPIQRGGALRLITARDPEALDVIRHSAEHVMADAVKRLWPGTKIDVGRSGRDGKFQYDFDIPVRLSHHDLASIEAEMQRIVDADLAFEREATSHAGARRVFEDQADELKVSRIDDLARDAEITLFRHGDFVDVCRGPHVQRTGQIGAFKLTDLAGSYWRGDESNPMLQRIYGVAFSNAKELRVHEARLAEALKRDHRRVGADLELFMFHDWAPGQPFYLPKGLVVYNELVEYMRSKYQRYGLEEVMAPLLFSSELFKTSGHWDNFRDEMFAHQDEDQDFGIKPMNCPGHCLIFRSRKRSYRELPLGMAEFSRLHRYERSGSLHGMTRVRAMAQDDGHVFCEPDQLPAQIDRQMELVSEVFRELGLEGMRFLVATRPEQYIGEPADWERGEQLLVDAVERAGYSCEMSPGEGAFYGPKIEVHFKDVLDRWWQLSTIQIDMAMSQRFGLTYVGRDGQEHTPAMLHRAILGSLERFIAIFLEHTAGDLPLWMAPLQALILPIADRHESHASKVCEALREAGVRAEVDSRNETLNYRVRSAETQKTPYTLVVGDKEQSDGTVTVRQRHNKAQQRVSVDEFVDTIREEIRTRGIS